MWEYNDPLNPTLKRPLSEVEIKAIRAELVEVQNQILNRAPGVPANLENRLSPSDANQYIANQQYIWSQSAFPRLFVTPLSAIEVYKLPPTQKDDSTG